MSKKKLQYYEPLPGSHKQRSRARNLLKCIDNGGESWIVSGGESEHFVIRRNGAFLCDCNIAQNEKKLCSHVIKVQMTLGAFPTESALVTR